MESDEGYYTFQSGYREFLTANLHFIHISRYNVSALNNSRQSSDPGTPFPGKICL